MGSAAKRGAGAPVRTQLSSSCTCAVDLLCSDDRAIAIEIAGLMRSRSRSMETAVTNLAENYHIPARTFITEVALKMKHT